MPRGGLKSCTEGGKIAQEENNFRARVARAGQNNSFPPLTNFSSTPLIPNFWFSDIAFILLGLYFYSLHFLRLDLSHARTNLQVKFDFVHRCVQSL